ncbi:MULTISPECIES: uroporphyrinogen-III synthase [Gordonia]|uniref:uroporphyrinogen-III synthase n=1 Tax=Gordonia TaxID=2053 RepID=UPI0007EB3A11|nr:MULTISPECIES: uroporphyrinogen-III synthase [Gordonia]OBB99830.1 uroporphyrinogen-III synthase [Gordonia sp. 852002-50395_SCH5434458]OBC09480.1 uroporphyrinogen-III synthase [Gordonia sp. 852002-50816_SCH5313054-a]OBC13281.1 uroporphyrinogen-III synthase [Gordonia sp. 852002-50816_SCH5313054-c]
MTPSDPPTVTANPDKTLTGFTIGITAARRADEFAALLTRRGAEVIHAPAIRIIPLIDDDELERATESILKEPPDVMVATTGIGFRGWVEAADGWGLADDLVDTLGGVRLLARGPKAKGAIRAAGLREQWSPPSESSSELIRELLDEGVAGLRVAVQLHGATTSWEPLPDLCDVLREAGAEVVPVPVYRWTPPDDTDPMARMIDAVINRDLDAVTFTSAPAVASMLGQAHRTGALEPLLHAMRTVVPAMCVGNVTAGPLHALQVPTVQPARFRLGALVRLIAEELPRRASVLRVAGHDMSLRASGVVVDGCFQSVTGSSMALLRVLHRVPGQVISRKAMLDELPGGGTDTHAVEMAVTRLRSALGDSKMIQTVVKRGYRLAVDLEYDENDSDDA